MIDQFILDICELPSFVKHLMGGWKVIAPVPKENRFCFDHIKDPSEFVIHYDTTILPPVKWLYPNNDVILKFSLAGINSKGEDAVTTGLALCFLHPCDINAIKIMDEVLAEEPADQQYVTRRRSALIIGLECFKECRHNILCHDKGYNRVKTGFDLFFSEVGRTFHITSATEKGEASMESFQRLKRPSYSENVELIRIRREAESQFKDRLKGDTDNLSSLLKKYYSDEIWQEYGKRCLSCGACNIVCPTCYCFDTKDCLSPEMSDGVRIRRWDSCQLHGFCKVASGENFRDSAAKRLRHRLFKKEVYLKKRFGRSGCVGCGRCVDSCIASISITDIYNDIYEKEISTDRQ